METAIVLSIFISSILLGITGYSIYTAFGPISNSLRDPFEEHEE
uniref:Protein PsbN n=1 Tax=Halydictyon mirabile TaxID=189652 RepID=A0A4D6WWI1_9FLOR|nr:photosystem II protein N [Halydictyon mirabile]